VAGAFTRLGCTDVRAGGKADWYDASLPFETATPAA